MAYKPRDYYAKKAKQEKYPARSVYKLKEADQKYRLLRRGQKVLDLGAAPGSWSKYALEKVGKTGLVVGVDLNPVKVSAPNFVFFQADIFELSPEELCEKTGVSVFDAVLSDMAPKTTGDRSGDHFRSVHLAERALEIAEKVLKPGGVFLVKVFEGEAFPRFVEEVKKRLGPVKRFRPKSTRSESREIFVLARRES
ncbi:RlmE family RNA methyltransferase [Thermodesulfatator autotrophicus]|uniref:Ribosomal RNA large subunit methyltransferase E n=1 Tax=Thermodesulfatator autotrophicus TaxID=1795632 RepID=A0A177E9A9_9BACT|nr:RlmE family RNA methyltransferase [Thermodesulfatator autotrophicus]OAG28081.1 50S rRNA methyltransferase [Thermodesulfatator autotrophicus]